MLLQTVKMITHGSKQFRQFVLYTKITSCYKKGKTIYVFLWLV